MGRHEIGWVLGAGTQEAHSNHDNFYVCLGVTPYEEPRRPERPVLTRIQRAQTSLVTQWLGSCLPMQRIQVWSLVGEEVTCRRATKPVPHNHWAHVPQPSVLMPSGLETVCHDEEWPPLAVTRESLHIARPSAAKREKKSRGTIRWADIVMNPVYRWGNWGSKGLADLPRSQSQLVGEPGLEPRPLGPQVPVCLVPPPKMTTWRWCFWRWSRGGTIGVNSSYLYVLNPQARFTKRCAHSLHPPLSSTFRRVSFLLEEGKDWIGIQ